MKKLVFIFVLCVAAVFAQTTYAPLTGFFSGGPVAVLWDKFVTAVAAPIPSPHTAQPGPGSWTIVDTGNKATISGSTLNYSSGNLTDPRFTSALYPMYPGRALMFSAAGRFFGGFLNSTATTLADYGIWLRNGSWGAWTGGLNAYPVSPTTLASGNTYQYAIIQREFGFTWWVKGNEFSSWTLFWISGQSDRADYTAHGVQLGSGESGTGTTTYSNVRLMDLNGVWASRFGQATGSSYFPANPQTISSTADGMVMFNWKPVAAEILDIQFRRTDDSNCLIARFDQAGNTMKLFSKVAGVEVQLATTAFTWGTSGRTLYVNFQGTSLRARIEGQTSITATSAINQSVAGVKATGASLGSSFASFPSTAVADIAVSGSPAAGFFPMGDSKTVGSVDTTGYWQQGYPIYLSNNISTAAKGWYEYPARLATSGWKTADLAAATPAALAAATGPAPNYAIIDIGVNDASSGTSQASFEASYGQILDALHVKWPRLRVLVAQVWSRGNDVPCDLTDDVWIPNVLATRSWASIGLDERVTLKGNDNGNTYTVDGTHPNHIGFLAMAAVWQASMGF